ncbi:hypothetical protein EXW96_26305 [Paenibacillus sp. JMULE4]|uniref:DUF7667 family protein n=1 Tax=Paenibacillus sp. JMULE4 TaxID=2518342 RepID=UPI0015774212|nr:hypothetical protein [Paenibacillus sp. JMULE4]NTZ20902.1 hypothetical protein [Paenibacillus sp. JMULE4]
MIAIHPIHRRLAELQMKAERLGGWGKLPKSEQQEISYCLTVNAKLVYELDALKSLAFHAHEMGDLEWEQDLCRKIDELEVKMI